MEIEEGVADTEMSVYRFSSSRKVPLESSLHIMPDSRGRESWMRVCHDAMNVIVKPQQKSDLRGFSAKSRKLIEVKCVPLLMSYCCENSKAKYISAARHGVAFK